jgi:GxxExxY protein
MVGATMTADHLSRMKHEATKDTKTHEGERRGPSWYREPAAKARARAVSEVIIAGAIEVHRRLGPGLLESVYRACLAHELGLRGIERRQEVALPVCYRGLALEVGHRLDLLVENLVIVELKSVERLEPVHRLQLLTYLRLSERWMGLLINFNTDLLKHGLRRVLDG